MRLQRHPELPVVLGDRFTGIAGSPKLAVFDEGEILLQLERAIGASGAGPETLQLRCDRLLRQLPRSRETSMRLRVVSI